MLNDRLARTIALIGEDNMKKISNASVMVVGCGAVGGYALEMIARLGFGKIIVVDFDEFEESNLNRQILALESTLKKKKVEAAKSRILDINKDAEVIAIDKKIEKGNLDFILEYAPCLVVDAIDDVNGKCELISWLVENNIEFVSAMGAGLKTKPEMLKVDRLDKTKGCNLAKKIRDNLRHNGVDLKKVECVYSDESVKICKDENGNNVLGSLPIVPAVMGIMLANQILNKCIKEK